MTRIPRNLASICTEAEAEVRIGAAAEVVVDEVEQWDEAEDGRRLLNPSGRSRFC